MNFKGFLATLSFFMSLSFVANAAIGDFAGQWEGRGNYILSGDLTNCGVMSLTFAANNNQFKFVTGERNCDKHTEKFYPVTLKADGGKLFFNGEIVGSYTEETMNLAFRMPEGNGQFRNWRMSMRVSGDHLMYEESRTMDGEKTPLISFAGLLIRQK